MASKYDYLLPVYTEEELAAEEWRIAIVGGEKFFRYAISNLGRVRNIATGKLLKQLWCHAVRGEASVYWRVCMSKGNERKAYLIHRLVAEAFVPGKTKRKKHVHHKDHNTTNPRASNLEWVTPKKNAWYYMRYKEKLEKEMRAYQQYARAHDVYYQEPPEAPF